MVDKFWNCVNFIQETSVNKIEFIKKQDKGIYVMRKNAEQYLNLKSFKLINVYE